MGNKLQLGECESELNLAVHPRRQLRLRLSGRLQGQGSLFKGFTEGSWKYKQPTIM
jgi:hypothetical protein